MQGDVKNKLQYDPKRASANNKKKKKVTKSREEKRDTYTVFAVIAAFFFIVIVLSFIPGDVIDITKLLGHMSKDKQEAIKDAKPLLYGAGLIFLLALIFCLVKRGKKKKSKEDREDRIEKMLMEQEKLNEAKRRVESARKNKDSELEEMFEQDTRQRNKGFSGRDEHFDGEIHSMKDMDMEDRKAYLEKRQREYRSLMENTEELDGYILETDEGDEPGTYDDNNQKKVFIAMIAVAAVIVVIIGFILFRVVF